MPRKSRYSIAQRVQACEDYHNGTRSLEEICIDLGTPMVRKPYPLNMDVIEQLTRLMSLNVLGVKISD